MFISPCIQKAIFIAPCTQKAGLNQSMCVQHITRTVKTMAYLHTSIISISYIEKAIFISPGIQKAMLNRISKLLMPYSQFALNKYPFV